MVQKGIFIVSVIAPNCLVVGLFFSRVFMFLICFQWKFSKTLSSDFIFDVQSIKFPWQRYRSWLPGFFSFPVYNAKTPIWAPHWISVQVIGRCKLKTDLLPPAYNFVLCSTPSLLLRLVYHQRPFYQHFTAGVIVLGFQMRMSSSSQHK